MRGGKGQGGKAKLTATENAQKISILKSLAGAIEHNGQ
jgi:hypothetical protein